MSTWQDDLNRSVWSRRSSLRYYRRVATYTDLGERAALEYLAPQVRGKPILDLGVGMGRTIQFLEPLTDDYRALDYTPSMIAACRERHPGVALEVGDARTLVGYPDGHFGLVNFSFNGIDSVSHADRRLVLRAVRRVLSPGGLFFFSTLNLDGPSFRERPWKFRVWAKLHPLRYAWQVARHIAWSPRSVTNWMRNRTRGERGDGWAVAPLSAHYYGLLVHYTTLQRQMSELEQEGFDKTATVFENSRGARVREGDNSANVDWFHIVATKAAAG
jgi:SAM-dependent methyltransferase